MKYAPSSRFAQYVRKAMRCGHWEDAEKTEGNHIAYLRHVRTGRLLSYQTHDGGNDQNSPRNMARDAQEMCGCKFIEVRGRKRSRKAIVNPLDERRAEAVVQTEINDLLAEAQELSAAIPAAARAAFNSRTASSQRFLNNLRRQYSVVADRLTELWPDWKEDK